MKIAVTGASGFIGRHTLVALQRRGVEVVAATRQKARLANLGPDVRVVELDLAHPPADAYDGLGRPDGLIHLAWEGLPNYRSKHHLETELPRQFRFLQALVQAGLPSLLVTGTCFEYGLQSGLLAAEQPTRPDNPYGLAKDALRRQLEQLKAVHPFQLTWARLFYLYGEGQAPTSLYPQLQAAAARGDRTFPMSGGEQLRDYLPVTEVAETLAALALARRDLDPVNLCSGTPLSVRSLVERWIAENRWDIRPDLGHYPYPDYEPMAFWGDRRSLDAILGSAEPS